MRERLQQQLARQPQSAELRLALAQLCLREKDAAAAAEHAAVAAELKPDYSAAWLLAARAAHAQSDQAAALEWIRRCVQVAQAQGDKQIERQAQVFLKRWEQPE